MKELKSETLLDALIDFAQELRFENLPDGVVREAKRRLIDSFACLIGGERDPAVRISREVLTTYTPRGFPRSLSTLYIAAGGVLTPWDSAYLATHLIRVLDWNDTYLSLEPAHPSDAIGALLACAAHRPVSGKDFLTAMVIAYDIQCRFCDAASLRSRGWDHVNYVTMASALAAGRLWGLSKKQMKDAVSLALNSSIVMRQVRGGRSVSMEKGSSSANATRAALFSVMRALCGFTGPSEIFEGNHGFINQVSGPLRLEAFDGLGVDFKLPETHIKVYPVEYHAQAVVEVALRLHRAIKDFSAIRRITITSYEAARTIIGDEAKRRPNTKESADHSIYYIFAVALLDGKMTLRQYKRARFQDPKVLALIDKMEEVRETRLYNDMYYLEHRCPVEIEIEFDNGAALGAIADPKGHCRRPISEDELLQKCKKVVGEKEWKRRMKPMLPMLWDIERQSDVRLMCVD